MSRLSVWPCAASAGSIEEVHARDVDRDAFVRTYVDRARPCVLRGLAAKWEPCRSFGFDLLRRHAKAGDEIGPILTEPLVESDAAARRRASATRWDYAEFLDALEAEDDAFLTAYGVHCRGPLAGFERDLGFLDRILPEIGPGRLRHGDGPATTGLSSFLKTGPSSPRGYPQRRLYLYRNGFTDWHYHRADETLTVQVAGKKTFAFVGPDRESFDVLTRIRGYKWLSASPELASLRMQTVTLEPGDAIYIPVYWWHAAESAGVGATWALTFSSPWHVAGDMRLPAARNLLRVNARTPGLRKFVPPLLLAAAWATVHNSVTGRRWDR